MRVAWNAWFLGQESTGSGQYAQHLLQALGQLDSGNEYLLYTMGRPGVPSPSGPYGLQALPTPFTGLSDNLAKLWFEQVSFARACRSAGVDLCHVPYFASPLSPTVPTVVTVHDLVPLLLPLYRGSLLVRLYARLVSVAARRADQVITDSLHSKGDIVRHLRVPPERVHPIYLAAHPACRPVADENVLAATRTKYGLPPTYILYLGGFDQRKNVFTLLQAYARLCRSLQDETPALVVAGRLPPADTPLFPAPQRMARELDVTQKVVFAGWVAEEDKPALYSGALFLAFLSLYEGFGLMPLEAMSCGTPVLVANTSSLPEIVGKGGVWVDPKNPDEIAEQMRVLVQDTAQRQHLAQEALLQAAKFSWRDTAQQTLRVYHVTAGQEFAPANSLTVCTKRCKMASTVFVSCV